MGAKRSPTIKLAADGTVERRVPRSLMDESEMAHICSLIAKGDDPRKIAKTIGRSKATVYRFLSRLRDDKDFGRMYLKSKNQFLAKRLLGEASTADILEIFDRNGVLPKKQREAVQQGPSVIVAVGMPGQPAMIAPTQTDVTKALAQANAPPVTLPMPAQGATLTAPVIDAPDIKIGRYRDAGPEMTPVKKAPIVTVVEAK